MEQRIHPSRRKLCGHFSYIIALSSVGKTVFLSSGPFILWKEQISSKLYVDPVTEREFCIFYNQKLIQINNKQENKIYINLQHQHINIVCLGCDIQFSVVEAW